MTEYSHRQVRPVTVSKQRVRVTVWNARERRYEEHVFRDGYDPTDDAESHKGCSGTH